MCRTVPPLLLLLLCCLGVTGSAAQNPFLTETGGRTIQSIRFEGVERTHLYVLERELGFAKGDPYDAAEVNDAWSRLEQLPFIAYVEIETERPRPDVVELIIRVEEEGIFRWQLGLEYSRRLDGRFYGTVRAGTVNALGRADELELQLNAWALRQARLRWSNPWILGPARLGVDLSAGIFDHAWVYDPAPDAENTETFLEGGLRRNFGPGFHARLGARWRANELSDIPGPVAPNAFGEGTPVGDQSVDTNETAFLATLGFDNRDSQYYPSRGLNARVDWAVASLSDDFDGYQTVDVSLAGFVPVPWLHTIGGFVTRRFTPDALPWYERTFYGGPEDLRGVEFATERGDERLRGSVEVRRPIFVVPLRAGRSIGLGAHAFSDWGAAWDHDADASDQRFRHSFGAGLHFNFNTYNYRFEWARHGDENFFVFEDHFTF